MTEPLRLARAPAVREVLARRSTALATLRAQLLGDGFLEADVPVMLPCAGQEPWLRPPRVEVAGLPGPLWLQTSPELPLKHLLVDGGPERLFALGPAFRGGREELGDLHQPQFTLLEWYEPGSSTDVLVDRCRALGRALADALERPAPPDGVVLDLAEAFDRWAGTSLEPLLDGDREGFVREAAESGLTLRPQDEPANLVGRVLVERVEPALAREPGWVFLRGWPAALAALGALDPDDPRKALRVEAYLSGVELANGWVELWDADELGRRWDAERALREDEPPPVDRALLDALRRVPPGPTAGMAMGFDRLLMVVLGERGLDAVLPLRLALPGP